MLKFCVKVLNSSYFPDHIIDWVYFKYDDRYRSKVVINNIRNHAYGLQVKVTDLELLCKSFTLKFPTAHIFETPMDLVYNWYNDRYQYVLFNNTITHTYDLKVKVTDLELLCQSFA